MHLAYFSTSPQRIITRTRKSFQLNHCANKVFYSVDDKPPISFTHPITSNYSQSLKISKSLSKVRSRQRDQESLGNKLEERMKIRRAINLEKIYEDNTRMFARIYTQKSEYRYNKVSQLLKRPQRILKENLEGAGESVDLEESKIRLMRQRCSTKDKLKLGYLREGLKSIALNEFSRSEAIKYDKSPE